MRKNNQTVCDKYTYTLRNCPKLITSLPSRSKANYMHTKCRAEWFKVSLSLTQLVNNFQHNYIHFITRNSKLLLLVQYQSCNYIRKPTKHPEESSSLSNAPEYAPKRGATVSRNDSLQNGVPVRGPNGKMDEYSKKQKLLRLIPPPIDLKKCINIKC